MDVTREEVLRCADLTGLRLREDEIEPLRQDMARLLSHAESLNALLLDAVAPTTHGPDIALPRRDDRIVLGLSQTEALANAPETDQGHFKVPKVLG